MTAASLAVLKIMLDDDVPGICLRTGAYFRGKLLELKARHPNVREVRGIGLLLGIKLAEDGEPIVKACLQKGFLVNCVQGDILRFVPPLIVAPAEIDRLIDCLDDVLGGGPQSRQTSR